MDLKNFNSLSGFAERIENSGIIELSKLRSLLQNTKLFYFEGDSKEFLPKQVDQKLFDDFRLPFNSIAVEDFDSIIVINEVDDSNKESGFKRFFWEYRAIDTTKYYIGYGETSSNISSTEGGTNILLGDWDVVKAWIIFTEYKKFEMQEVLERDQYYNIFKIEFINNSYTALQELIFACRPSKFILEVTPGKIRAPKKNKIPRAHERQLYTLLEPDVIRKRMNIPTTEAGGKKLPHERRGHWRTLTSEFFKEKRGQVIWIDPVWIGPSEAKIGNKLYKVRLDL